MSISDYVPSVFFGPSDAAVADCAKAFDEWVGVRRAALALGDRFQRIVDKTTALPNDWPGTYPRVSAALALQPSLTALFDQVGEHDRQLASWIGQCVDAGELSLDDAAATRERFGLQGLGAFPLVWGVFAVFAAAVLGLVGSFIAAQQRRVTSQLNAQKQALESMLSAEERATDIEIEQARAANRPVNLPTRQSGELVKSPPLVSIGTGAGIGFGALVAIGGGFWLLTRLKGGRRK